MSFISKNIEKKNLRFFQLLIDLSSDRFSYLTKTPPKSQKDAIEALSKDIDTTLINSMEKAVNNILDVTKKFLKNKEELQEVKNKIYEEISKL